LPHSPFLPARSPRQPCSYLFVSLCKALSFVSLCDTTRNPKPSVLELS
jgi:hypothetical protein